MNARLREHLTSLVVRASLIGGGVLVLLVEAAPRINRG